MEHCDGGDLFSYLEDRNFKLKEARAAEIIHKLSSLIWYSTSRSETREHFNDSSNRFS